MRDFGGIVERTPACVIRVETVAEVEAAIRAARAKGLPVKARGQGHTTRGQSLTDGVSIELRGLRHVSIDLAARTARVGAGLLWSELLTATLSVGLVPPTLTDYLGLSIGGTLSVGGIGGQSFRHGAQTDQVEALVVVTPHGDIVECSTERERALFDACRAGLGRFGTIVEAVVRLHPAPKRAMVSELTYANLEQLIAAQRRFVEQDAYDYLLGSILPTPNGWAYKLEAVTYDGAQGAGIRSMSYLEHALRLDQLVAQMKLAGTWTALHPWMDLFVPASAATELIGEALALLDPSELADGHLMTYPLTRSTTPLLALPAEPQSFLFDVLPNLRERAALPRFEERCHRITELVRTAGGGIYPIGYPIGTADERPGDLLIPLEVR
jgi:cytokinin dehydrogenase